MNFDYKTIKGITRDAFDSFYFLDIEQFNLNYSRLLNSFRKFYKNTHIAYSYKTNYIPDLCKIIDANGGYAEVVSEMEYKLAKSIGVSDYNIYYNGPYKSKSSMESLLVNGGYLNIDSCYEMDIIEAIAQKYTEKVLKVGIRCNIEINDGVLSRFGFDVNAQDFDDIIKRINSVKNVNLVGLHLHIASRTLDTWKPRVEKIIQLIEQKFDPRKLEFVSVGGGLYGNMHESLKKQFSDPIPSYEDYSSVVAREFAVFANKYGVEESLKLLIEPGSALAGDSMQFISKVINIKNIRGKSIGTLAGSIYNINPTLNKKNPPIQIVYKDENSGEEYIDLDFGGYTCIESDYLYKGFSGKLSVGDYVVFSNVGSYSIVMKPPFILPNFGIFKIQNGELIEVKKRENFRDIFSTYEAV
jgi:diaminopimelate decarboxylase